MGIVQDKYDRMATGEVGSICATSVAPDAGTPTVEDFERFEYEVRALEAMARAGLVASDEPHTVRLNGRTFTDLVKFRKLA